MANKQSFLYITILIILFVMIDQTYEMSLDCQEDCKLRKQLEHNEKASQICRDECELFGLLTKQDEKLGEHYKYKLF
ncbi:unnamed protein product [Adineta steineri]|uniref:Transmembrane protein n=1 Tax=Adineta steineri TaxID=433720 RepID=A0A814QFR7_9BILA|nr:unnamed protein product [Adineta steineri]